MKPSLLPAAGLLLCTPLSAQVTQRVSVDSVGAQGNAGSWDPRLSQNGRFVVFYSLASNLVAGDTNNAWDVFVRDRWTGGTERVSVSSGGVEGNADSGGFNAPVVSISADGRYVAFGSLATNLVANDMNSVRDIFIRDRQSGTTERLLGFQGSGVPDADYNTPTLSADGRYVAFESAATTIVLGDTNMCADAFVVDRQTLAVELVSVATDGTQADFVSGSPRISADGRYVAFESFASNLDANDTNGFKDVFVRDRQTATTQVVSLTSGGASGNEDCFDPAISADGRFVSFSSDATDLVAGDTNAKTDVFLRDRQSGTTERVSVATGGAEANAFSGGGSPSSDGRWILFTSTATNLVASDTNGASDVFLRDRQSGTTVRVDLSTGGAQANGGAFGYSISTDGRFAAFSALASNLVGGDTNAAADVFVRDTNASGFTLLCEPGVAGVVACPCSNPPGGSGRGCNNSSATGGATLSATGTAYLSSDSLVFTTSGERPTALSLLMQGPSLVANGLVYGQGVRCAGGSMKRLFSKNAVAGSVTVPDFGAGEPTVSVRSAAKGSVIQAGQSRWYLVVYRDPVVLGGCPATSSFNATRTGRVDWSL